MTVKEKKMQETCRPTVCPRILDTFYIKTYCKIWAKTFWTNSMYYAGNT